MKKLLILLLTFIMALSIIGCTSKQEEEPSLIELPYSEEVEEETEHEEIIEEKEEVVEEEKTKEEEKTVSRDITQMYFWVVFYDQYDNELQREALKYGTVPEYKSWLPEGFDKWVYKRSGRDVGTFKAITGNTYYKAVCHEVYHPTGGGSDPAPAPDDVNYLYFKNIGDIDATIVLCSYGDSSLYESLEFQYSNDKEEWNNIVFNSTITIVPNETIYIKAATENDHVYYSSGGSSGGVYFDSSDDETSSIEVGGSVMTLLDPTDTLRDLTGKPGCFYYLFYSMENLKNADNLVLPATTLSPYCYAEMFEEDYYLETVNEDLLPVEDLSGADDCYYYMFYYCYALENSPTLPATTLSDSCYEGMFCYCYALNDTVVLPASDLITNCYKYMFYDCSIFNSLEVDFSSFDSLVDNECYYWLYDVAESGTFKWPGSLSIGTRDSSTVPASWTITN